MFTTHDQKNDSNPLKGKKIRTQREFASIDEALKSLRNKIITKLQEAVKNNDPRLEEFFQKIISSSCLAIKMYLNHIIKIKNNKKNTNKKIDEKMAKKIEDRVIKNFENKANNIFEEIKEVIPELKTKKYDYNKFYRKISKIPKPLISKALSKHIEEVRKHIYINIFYNNHLFSSYASIQRKIIEIARSAHANRSAVELNISDKNRIEHIVFTIGHELGHILFHNSYTFPFPSGIIKDEKLKNEDKRLENKKHHVVELLCDIIGIYSLSLFGLCSKNKATYDFFDKNTTKWYTKWKREHTKEMITIAQINLLQRMFGKNNIQNLRREFPSYSPYNTTHPENSIRNSFTSRFLHGKKIKIIGFLKEKDFFEKKALLEDEFYRAIKKHAFKQAKNLIDNYPNYDISIRIDKHTFLNTFKFATKENFYSIIFDYKNIDLLIYYYYESIKNDASEENISALRKFIKNIIIDDYTLGTYWKSALSGKKNSFIFEIIQSRIYGYYDLVKYNENNLDNYVDLLRELYKINKDITIYDIAQRIEDPDDDFIENTKYDDFIKNTGYYDVSFVEYKIIEKLEKSDDPLDKEILAKEKEKCKMLSEEKYNDNYDGDKP